MLCCYIILMSFIFYVLDSYCEKLSPPENGAITCEAWVAGLMCTVHCNEGYDMAFRPRPWYYCESDGNWRRGNTKWSKKPTVPECSGSAGNSFLADNFLKRGSQRFFLALFFSLFSLMLYAKDGSSGFLRGLNGVCIGEKMRCRYAVMKTQFSFNIFRTICY